MFSPNFGFSLLITPYCAVTSQRASVTQAFMRNLMFSLDQTILSRVIYLVQVLSQRMRSLNIGNVNYNRI